MYDSSTVTTLVTATANAPLAAFRAGQSTRPVYIYEIGIFGRTAPTTSGAIGIARSSALSVTPSGLVVGVPRDPARPNAGAGLITGWATAPTLTSPTFIRRWDQPATIGNGIIWTFDRDNPLTLVASGATSELVFANLLATAPGTFEIYVGFDE